MQNYAQTFTHSTKYDHICVTMMLTFNTSHCIGSLDCDRQVEKNQIAESLTVGPAVQIIGFTIYPAWFYSLLNVLVKHRSDKDFVILKWIEILFKMKLIILTCSHSQSEWLVSLHI